MVPELRKEEILKSIKKRDISYIKDLAAELNISLSTVRRDVAALEQEGSVIVMRGGAVKYKAEDFDEPVVKKKLIHSEEKEIIARKAAALVEDGDCVYVDSGTTTVGMLKYLQGKRITIVSSSTVVCCSGHRISLRASAISWIPVSAPWPTWLPG